MNNPIWKKSNYVAVWIYLLLNANHEEKHLIWNNQKFCVEKGAFIGSIKQIADHFGLSTGTVSYILDYFISEKMIEKTSTMKFTYFKVLNWDKYQDVESSFENKLKTNEKQAETNKNIKNIKKDTGSAGSVAASPSSKVDAVVGTTTNSKSPNHGGDVTFEEYLEREGYEEAEMYMGESEGMVLAWKHRSRKRPYTDEEARKRYNTHVRGQTSRGGASRVQLEASTALLRFAELCEKELGQKPVYGGKEKGVVKTAITKVGLKEVLDVIEDWFHQGKPDEETIQITRALSTNQLNTYRVRK